VLAGRVFIVAVQNWMGSCSENLKRGQGGSSVLGVGRQCGGLASSKGEEARPGMIVEEMLTVGARDAAGGATCVRSSQAARAGAA